MTEHLDSILAFGALAVVLGVLFVLLRRASREVRAEAQKAESVPVAVDVPAPSEPAMQVPAPPPLPEEPKAHKNVAQEPVTSAPTSPIHKVLGLLKSKDSIASAFLLREILDKPRSKKSL